MRKLFTTKRRIVIASTVTALALIGGGSAYAYFTASGTGTGTATVGSTGTWDVTQSSTTGSMYPGSGSTVIVFDVKNTGTGDQLYSSAVATLPEVGGDAESGGVDIPGCLASWFQAEVSLDPGLHTNIAGGTSVPVTVTVTMPTDATDNQDPCQGKTPDVNLAIS